MTTTNFIISRSAVEANPKIRLVDSDPTNNNISLFCYDTCDDNDDELVKSCRGIAFSGEELIFKGFPYTYEYTQKKNHDAINDLLSNNLCSIYDSFEGTLLRMFCYNNKWYLSTNRKLDANKSKWGSKTTFGEYFKQALEYEVVVSIKFREAIFREREGGDITAAAGTSLMDKFINLLDTSKQYMFLLLSNMENRIVCQYDHPKFLHVGTFSDGGTKFSLEQEHFIGLDYPKQHFFENIEQMYEYINSVDYKLLQGVIVFGPDNTQYKIMNEAYDHFYSIRGNESSIKFRYLQLRNDGPKCDILKAMYPEYVASFQYYETCIIEICNLILKGYINRYIRKQFVVLPLEQFIVMSEVHKWHVLDRDHNKVNINIVLQTLNQQNPVSINRMIKKYRDEQQKKSVGGVVVTTQI